MCVYREAKGGWERRRDGRKDEQKEGRKDGGAEGRKEERGEREEDLNEGKGAVLEV